MRGCEQAGRIRRRERSANSFERLPVSLSPIHRLSLIATVIQLLPFHLPYAMTVSPNRLSQPDPSPDAADASMTLRQLPACRGREGEQMGTAEAIGSINATG